MNETIQIVFKGIVQGIGFRPLLYRLLSERSIAAHVYNSARGVIVEMNTSRDTADTFIIAVRESMPPLGSLTEVLVDTVPFKSIERLTILESDDAGEPETVTPPDIAICDDCRRELFDSHHPKYRYPFINCTNCGPRYSILAALPYDRENTSMDAFAMCERCAHEYADPADRRFHAEPDACERCGPHLKLRRDDTTVLADGDETSIAAATALLLSGKIVAVKSIGGFHLACNAFDDEALKRLRHMKGRDAKPFAIMVRSVEIAKRYVNITRAEELLLTSGSAPIVLLPRRTTDHGIPPLPETIAPGNAALGIMLPYTPMHLMLFSDGLDILVMTSGNKKDEPIVIDDHEMMKLFENEADAFLVHNRGIHNRLDDSIVRMAGDQSILLRRSRGFVPYPITISTPAPRAVLALGSDVKNAFALARDSSITLSQYTGDLSSIANFYQMQQTVDSLKKLMRFAPDVIAVDMHPNYFSTQFGEHIAQTLELPVVSVQHHIAHAAALILEHGVTEPAAVFTFDGTGFGTDGTIWGGEIIRFDGRHYHRHAHLTPYALPGSDLAVREGRRVAASLLYSVYGRDFLSLDIPFVKHNDFDDILFQIEHKINAPYASSMGRLFDAVAALMGVKEENTFEGDAAIMLESIADIAETGTLTGDDELTALDFTPLIMNIVEAIRRNVPAPIVAGRFHNTIARIMLVQAKMLREETGIQVFGASGGVFQNAYIVRRAGEYFTAAGYTLLFHRLVAPNDECIALGQVAVVLSEEN
ncbi:MAG: carbamoyltransferase HypF [Spirochaetes bacterium]|nr:carbamoyltransferase HypF [Spirochaetota bacterium]